MIRLALSAGGHVVFDNAIVLVLGTVALFGADAWFAQLTEHNLALRAFVLSDRFWPALFGGIALAMAALLAGVLILAFVPSRSGRTVPERGE